MVWYGMVNVDLYSAIVTKVSNALTCSELHDWQQTRNFFVELSFYSDHITRPASTGQFSYHTDPETLMPVELSQGRAMWSRLNISMLEL